MAVTWVNTTSRPGGQSPQLLLAAAYESRATAIAKLFVPTAAFAGDTSQTLTDGSFNSNPASALKSSTAQLATTSNIRNAGNVESPTLADSVTAKPLIIKVRRDPLSGEIREYGVFNADGTYPGSANTTAVPGNSVAYDPFTGANRRYEVNRATGEIFLRRTNGLVGFNLDGAAGSDISVGGTGTNAVVGLLEFKALEGAALSTAQQQASELSNVIQSLATLIRGVKDSEKTMLNVIR